MDFMASLTVSTRAESWIRIQTRVTLTHSKANTSLFTCLFLHLFYNQQIDAGQTDVSVLQVVCSCMCPLSVCCSDPEVSTCSWARLKMKLEGWTWSRRNPSGLQWPVGLAACRTDCYLSARAVNIQTYRMLFFLKHQRIKPQMTVTIKIRIIKINSVHI